MRYNNVTWYPFLIPRDTPEAGPGRSLALLDEHPLSQLGGGKLVVQWETPEASPVFRGAKRAFAVFDFYTDFYRFQQQVSPENRCFYELILGEQAQKPHFDIDLPVTGDPAEASKAGGRLLRALIRGCRAVFAEHGRALDLERDLCVYTSHGDTKRSYHLVLNHHCHRDNAEARAFYEAVMEHVDDPNRGAVDAAVYSSKQLFRIVGSTKRGKDRVKRFVEDFEIGGTHVKHVYSIPERVDLSILYESLVTMTVECAYFPRLVKEREYSSLPQQDLSEEDVGLFLSLLAESAAAGDYSVASLAGSVLNLRRNRASRCPVCERSHNAENPYMFCVGENVYWNCRRSEGGRSFLVGRRQVPAPQEDIAPEPAPVEPPRVRQGPRTQVLERMRYLRAQTAAAPPPREPAVERLPSRAGLMPRAVYKPRS